jgi:hypothetical protein
VDEVAPRRTIWKLFEPYHLGRRVSISGRSSPIKLS